MAILDFRPPSYLYSDVLRQDGMGVECLHFALAVNSAYEQIGRSALVNLLFLYPKDV